jgi:hypothetical protein
LVHSVGECESDGTFEGIAAAIREWRSERNRLAVQLAGAGQGEGQASAEAEIAEAEKQLWTLREGLEEKDPMQVRAVLRELVDRVELWWEHEQVGPFLKARFSRGVIYLKADQQVFHTCQRNQRRVDKKGTSGVIVFTASDLEKAGVKKQE